MAYLLSLFPIQSQVQKNNFKTTKSTKIKCDITKYELLQQANVFNYIFV